MRVDPDSLMASGNRMQSSVQRIREEITAFHGELAGFGAPWGNDDLGSLIGEAYQVIYDMAMETYGANADEIDEVGQAAQVAATEYTTTDQANADDVRRLGSALDGW